jgi:hypothetical protein
MKPFFPNEKCRPAGSGNAFGPPTVPASLKALAQQLSANGLRRLQRETLLDLAAALLFVDYAWHCPVIRETMTDTRTDTELAEAILAAIDEARQHGIPDERIVEMLADIVRGLREALP